MGGSRSRSITADDPKGKSMSIWKHLFLTGEFSARADLLSGLTLEQVTLRPAGIPHSIYDELWHAATWQRIVVEREDVAGEGWSGGAELYPDAAPGHEQAWQDLVRLFLEGAQAAVAWGEAAEDVAREVEPGVRVADELASLAVHNAYHLGKIVAVRQMIGAWPPNAGTGRR